MDPYELFDQATIDAMQKSAQIRQISNFIMIAVIIIVMAIVFTIIIRKLRKKHREQLTLLDGLRGDAPMLMEGIKDKAAISKLRRMNAIVVIIYSIPILLLLCMPLGIIDYSPKPEEVIVFISKYWKVGLGYFLVFIIGLPILSQLAGRAESSKITITSEGVFGFSYPAKLSVSGVLLKVETASTLHLRFDEILSADLDQKGNLNIVTAGRNYVFFGMTNAFQLRECISEQIKRIKEEAVSAVQ